MTKAIVLRDRFYDAHPFQVTTDVGGQPVTIGWYSSRLWAVFSGLQRDKLGPLSMNGQLVTEEEKALAWSTCRKESLNATVK